MAKRGIRVDIPEGDSASIDKYINRLNNQVAKNGIPGILKERRKGYKSRNKRRKEQAAQAKREQRKKKN